MAGLGWAEESPPVAWWVALIVAVHLVSLAWIFHGPSMAFLGVAQTVALIVVALAARGESYPASRWAGPVMGALFLVYALGNGAFLVRELSSR